MQFDESEFAKIFEEMVQIDEFSGVVLVTKNSKIVFERAYGFADKRFNVSNQMNTKFNIGSLNKLITRIAILQLHQKDLLDFDDLVGKHLPEFPEAIASKVKIKHLLEFTSGMGDYFNDKFEASLGKLRTIDDFIPFFIDDELTFEPGERFQYSNAGYVVLGKIIESITGRDYYDYVRENIYAPAGMNDTDHFEVDSITPNLATGYTHYMPDESFDSTKRRCNYFIIGSRGSPAGGGYSTAFDLLRLDQAITSETLLDHEHSQLVFRPLDAPPESKAKSVGLAGGAPGLNALYLKYFESDYTVIILSNYDPEVVEPIAEKIRDIFTPGGNKGKIVKLGEEHQR